MILFGQARLENARVHFPNSARLAPRPVVFDGGPAPNVARFLKKRQPLKRRRDDQVVGQPLNLGDEPSSIYITADGAEAWVLDRDTVHVVDLTSATVVTFPIFAGTDEFSDLAVTPDESRAIIADADNRIYLLDTNTWTVLDATVVDEQK